MPPNKPSNKRPPDRVSACGTFGCTLPDGHRGLHAVSTFDDTDGLDSSERRLRRKHSKCPTEIGSSGAGSASCSNPRRQPAAAASSYSEHDSIAEVHTLAEVQSLLDTGTAALGVEAGSRGRDGAHREMGRGRGGSDSGASANRFASAAKRSGEPKRSGERKSSGEPKSRGERKRSGERATASVAVSAAASAAASAAEGPKAAERRAREVARCVSELMLRVVRAAEGERKEAEAADRAAKAADRQAKSKARADAIAAAKLARQANQVALKEAREKQAREKLAETASREVAALLLECFLLSSPPSLALRSLLLTPSHAFFCLLAPPRASSRLFTPSSAGAARGKAACSAGGKGGQGAAGSRSLGDARGCELSRRSSEGCRSEISQRGGGRAGEEARGKEEAAGGSAA